MLRKKIYIFIIMVTLALVSLSCDKSYDYNSGYSSFSHEIADKNYLIDQINSAKTSIKLSMRELTDTDVINAITSQDAAGISVKVVLDADSANPFGGGISLNQGNVEEHMDSNFLIIDDKYAVFMSTFDVVAANTNILYIKIKDENLINILNTEFKQMFSLNNFGSGDATYGIKQKINYLTNFTIGANHVEMYFLPQNAIIRNMKIEGSFLNSSYLLSRMQQVKRTAKVAVDAMNNTEIFNVLDEYSNYGVVSNMIFGNGQDTSAITGSYAQVSNRGGGETLPYRVFFLDPGTQFQSMIFTTFSLDATNTLDDYDGVLLIVTGPDVEKVYKSVKSDIGL